MREEYKTCENCKFEDRSEFEQPCCSCIHNATERFEPKENSWIPCSVRPPEEYGRYLATVEIGSYDSRQRMIKEVIFKNGKFYRQGIGNIVLAWMPLPELYKGGAE